MPTGSTVARCSPCPTPPATAIAPPAPPGWPAVVVRGLTKRYGEKLAVDRHRPRRAPRLLLRAGRAQRRRQDDVDPHDDRAAAARRRAGVGRGRTTSGPTPSRSRPRIGVLPDEFRLFDRLTGAELLDYCGLLRGMAPATGRRAGQRAARRARPARARPTRWSSTTAPACARRSRWPPPCCTRRRCCSSTSRSRRSTRCRPGPSASVLERFTDNGNTVVFSSHVMEVVERLCDRVAVVHQGRLIAEGATDELRGGRRLEDVFVELVGATRGRRGAARLARRRRRSPAVATDPRRRDRRPVRTTGARIRPGTLVRLKLRLIANRAKSSKRGVLAARRLRACWPCCSAAFGALDRARRAGRRSATRGSAARPRSCSAPPPSPSAGRCCPLLRFGSDETLDPGRLVLFPLRRGTAHARPARRRRSSGRRRSP